MRFTDMNTTLRTRMAACLLGLALTATAAQAQSPLASLEVFPADIHLTTARDHQSLVVQATFADGLTRDVTDQAKVAVANPALVKVEKNVVRPVADGETQMTVEF